MFREAVHYECMRRGDNEYYLWVIEPTCGEIYGKAYTISHTDLLRTSDETLLRAQKKQEAFDEMMTRVGKPEHRVPEGSDWEAFL